MQIPSCLKSLFPFRNRILERNYSKAIWIVLSIISLILLICAGGTLFFCAGASIIVGICLTILCSLCLGIGLFSFIKILQLQSLDNKVTDFLKREFSTKNRQEKYRIQQRQRSKLMSEALMIKKASMNFLRMDELDKINLFKHYSNLDQRSEEGPRRKNIRPYEKNLVSYLGAAYQFGSLFFNEFSIHLGSRNSTLQVWQAQLLDFLQYPFMYFLFRTKSYKRLNEDLGYSSYYENDPWILPESDAVDFYNALFKEYWIRSDYNAICQIALRFAENAKDILSKNIYDLILKYYRPDSGKDYVSECLKEGPLEDPNKLFLSYTLNGFLPN